MNETAIAMPPFKIASATLRKTTEHLARSLVNPSASPPDWNEFEWATARAAAAMQGISGLLANRSPWSGPSRWHKFLDEQREQTMQRDANIGSLLAQLDDLVRREQISCVGLKGSALRRLDIYDPGERPMGDIDLLVRDTDLESVDAVLGSLDYFKAATKQRHIIYMPRSGSELHGVGEDCRNPVPIEVHTVVAEALPVSKIDITRRIQPALNRPGLNAYPDPASLMLHLLLHAAGNIRAHALRHIQLYDIATLAGRLRESDWRSVLATPHTPDRPWWLFAPLALAERYFPESIPTAVLARARADCPPVLRFVTNRHRLTDVSWSNLRIPAFPGIAFSRTPLEGLRFVRSRVFPSRNALAELKETRRRRPNLDQLRWYDLPHGGRILRWLFSRPPRVQTMLSLRAALDSTRTVVD